MVFLPYVPTPYPDEVLCSALTRFVVHNGESVFRKISNSVAHLSPNLSIYQASPPHPAVVAFITDQMGLPGNEVTDRLTTSQFFRVFNTAHKRPLDLETAGYGTRSGRLRSLGFIPCNHQPAVRFCPSCLDEDFKKYGEPYLHRIHQMQPALTCTVHEEWLRISCPKCKMLVVPINRMVLRPMPIVCECGADLRSLPVRKSPVSSAFKRLSKFCADSIFSKNSLWSHAQVKSAASEALGLSPQDFSTGYIKSLIKVYGKPISISPHKFVIAPPSSDCHLRLNLDLGRFKAEDFASLFTAAGLTFDESALLISKNRTVGIHIKQRSPKYVYGLKHAEEVLLNFSKAYPGEVATKFQRSHPRLYWLLRIHHPDSIKRWCPKLKTLPPIESDRKKLGRLLKKNGDFKKIFASASRPLFRAIVRDQNWLISTAKLSPSDFTAPPLKPITKLTSAKIPASKNLSTPTNRKKEHKNPKIDDIERDLVFALMKAIRIERRPHKITRSRLSQLSSRGVSSITRATPPGSRLHTMISKINADKDRRLALWAAQALALAGTNMTPTTVLLAAGLNTTSRNREHARSAIDLLSSGLSRQAIRESFNTDPEQIARLHRLNRVDLKPLN